VHERETLGSYLKNQRESKKISLRDVAKNTRVREYILRAIEEDRQDLLPAATYVKGFLLAYAKYLNLDRKDILLRYERVLKGEPIKEEPVKREPVKGEPVPPPPAPSPKPKQKSSWSTRQTWVVGGVIVASFIVFYFFSPYSSKPLIEPGPEKPILEGKSPVASSPPVVAATRAPEEKTAVEEKQPLAPSPPAAATNSVPEKKPFSLQMKAVEETWVSLQVEGQSEREMTFKPGEGLSVLASSRVHMIIGNAGGLNLIWNGKALDRFGKSGEVVKLIITSQGVEVKPPEKSESQ
jgi:cytoskeleton protein RodZ